MALIRLRTIFGWVFVIGLVPMYVLVKYGQGHWGFDNLGLWYTVYCIVAFAALLALVALGAAVAVRSMRKPRTTQDPGVTDA